jgi:hypothetical protein
VNRTWLTGRDADRARPTGKGLRRASVNPRPNHRWSPNTNAIWPLGAARVVGLIKRTAAGIAAIHYPGAGLCEPRCCHETALRVGTTTIESTGETCPSHEYGQPRTWKPEVSWRGAAEVSRIMTNYSKGALEVKKIFSGGWANMAMRQLVTTDAAALPADGFSRPGASATSRRPRG